MLSWASALLLALPAHASALADEWRDLHGRCADAVPAGAPLDVRGLVPLAPALLTEPVTVDLLPGAGDAPDIPRVTDPGRIGGDLAATDLIGRQRERQAGRLPSQAEIRDALRPDPSSSDAVTLFERRVAPVSARTVPAGPWAVPGGTLRLQVLEYPTRPGTRAICEVQPMRGASVPRAVAQEIFAAFRARHGTEGDGERMVTTVREANARGCRVVASVTWREDFFRSSVGEAAGDPSCGGPSLLGSGGVGE